VNRRLIISWRIATKIIAFLPFALHSRYGIFNWRLSSCALSIGTFGKIYYFCMIDYFKNYILPHVEPPDLTYCQPSALEIHLDLWLEVFADETYKFLQKMRDRLRWTQEENLWMSLELKGDFWYHFTYSSLHFKLLWLLFRAMRKHCSSNKIKIK
jgi:hypothetical protein